MNTFAVRSFILFTIAFLLFSCGGQSVLDSKELEGLDTHLSVKKRVAYKAQDIPLGATLASLDLDHYESYGEFIDNHFLDFYYIDNTFCHALDINAKQVMLYFSDGQLIKKRYTFDHDILSDIEEKFLKGKEYTIPPTMKELKMRSKNGIYTYVRGSEFQLYEMVSKK